jgi:hypothetical protein
VGLVWAESVLVYGAIVKLCTKDVLFFFSILFLYSRSSIWHIFERLRYKQLLCWKNWIDVPFSITFWCKCRVCAFLVHISCILELGYDKTCVVDVQKTGLCRETDFSCPTNGSFNHARKSLNINQNGHLWLVMHIFCDRTTSYFFLSKRSLIFPADRPNNFSRCLLQRLPRTQDEGTPPNSSQVLTGPNIDWLRFGDQMGTGITNRASIHCSLCKLI